LQDDLLWEQLLSRDPALNGQFLAGFLNTGVYCLPSCRARTPKRETVRFFRAPQEAKRSGLRPCGRCKPDSQYPGSEGQSELFAQIAAGVRLDPRAYPDTASIGRAAGVTWTALNALFRDYAQESPAAFLRRVRVRHAMNLLRGGGMPAEASMAAGFESESAFSEQFVSRAGLAPADYVGLRQSPDFALHLPEGYRFRTVVDFYGRDPQAVSERVTPDSVTKCMLDGDCAAVLQIRCEGAIARCRTDASNVFDAHAAAIRMLGLDSDAAGFERRFSGDSLLGATISRQRGLRIPLTPTPWEALAWAIIGQQINLPFAITLRRALILAAGTAHGDGLRAHPSAETVAAMDVDTLRGLKFSGSKAGYLLSAARAVATGDLDLAGLRDLSADRAAQVLGAVKGVGPWTIQYMFLRGLGFPDSLPAGDAGLAQGLAKLTGARPSESEIRDLLAPYSPWRSLATYHVWAGSAGVEA
jgi:AraC family transcriptional regulator of adaptative response / DNA-3-methyladenine glycosylase II